MANGIFDSPSVEEIRELERLNRQLQSQKLGSSTANLFGSPWGSIAYQGAQIGHRGGEALRGMFGAGDSPEVQRAQQIQSIKQQMTTSGLTPENPDFYSHLSKLLSERGFHDAAMKAGATYNEMRRAQERSDLDAQRAATDAKRAAAYDAEIRARREKQKQLDEEKTLGPQPKITKAQIEAIRATLPRLVSDKDLEDYAEHVLGNDWGFFGGNDKEIKEATDAFVYHVQQLRGEEWIKGNKMSIEDAVEQIKNLTKIPALPSQFPGARVKSGATTNLTGDAGGGLGNATVVSVQEGP